MRLSLIVEIPSNVGERELSQLLTAVKDRQGITLNVPGSFKHQHTVACTSSHIDVDLVDVERADSDAVVAAP